MGNCNPINVDEYRLTLTLPHPSSSPDPPSGTHPPHPFPVIVGILWSFCLVNTPPLSWNCRYPLIPLSTPHPTLFLELPLLELPLPFPGITLPGIAPPFSWNWWRHFGLWPQDDVIDDVIWTPREGANKAYFRRRLYYSYPTGGVTL